MKIFPLLALVIFVCAEETKLPPIVRNASWECGSDETTKLAAKHEIMAECPELRDEINSCCLNHDKCYDDRKGQKYCDDVFCNCMEVRSRPSKYCHDVSSPGFCYLVQWFGHNAYEQGK